MFTESEKLTGGLEGLLHWLLPPEESSEQVKLILFYREH